MKSSQPRISIYPYWKTDLNLIHKLHAKSKSKIIEDSMLGVKSY